ncbi:hypothetical protein AYI68_g3353 [Smittium mucronatum]|uniref:Uncharacterized protein n=1 Tax=Smittium mucronatum TaxID=133383 RepID=A0A1R0H066_9FUNG|nr:hypothetical protein AYI68_g3353 [Smittium mucronatum]
MLKCEDSVNSNKIFNLVHIQQQTLDLDRAFAKIDDFERILAIEESNLAGLEALTASLEAIYQTNTSIGTFQRVLHTMARKDGPKPRHKVWVPPDIQIPQIKSHRNS